MNTNQLVVAALALAVIAGPAAALLPGDVPGVTGAPWGAWRTETLDERFIGWFQTGIDLDAQGDPHVVYDAESPPLVVVASHDGVQWSRDAVDQGLVGDIALDGQGRPHVVYYRYGEDTRYATKDANGDWNVTVLADNPFLFKAAIEIDQDGHPHIVYPWGPTWSTVKLYHHYQDAQGWHVETLAQEGDGLNPTLALDSNGGVHVAHEIRDPPNGLDFGYTHNVNGSWVTEAVEGCWHEPALALDSQDRPHVACHAPGGLLHLTKQDGAWVKTMVDNGDRLAYKEAGEWAGHQASIAVDDEDRPHIAYRDKGNPFTEDPWHRGELRYATLTPNGWSVEVADHDGQHNGYASDIALDSQGRPHISYVTLTRLHAHLNEAVDPSFDLRYATPLAEPLAAVGE